MIITLAIANGTTNVVQQSDPTTAYLVYATWALVCATIFVGYLTIRFSQKQYETLHRPWLILDKDGRTVDNVSLYLENIGNLHAENITISCEPIFYHGTKKEIPHNSENYIVKIGVIIPKQKYQFTFDFLTVDNIMDCTEMTVDIFVKYYSGKKEKMGKFNYLVNNVVDLNEITCEEAT